MTLTELKYVLAVAQEKHFGRAAKKCFVSQPTLSVAIAKLEKTLGILLFERLHTELRVTDVGEKIIQQAQIVIEHAEYIKRIAKASKCQLKSPLKLGAIYTVAPYLFPSLIPKLNQIAPDMPLIVQENFTSELIKKLHHGELDAIFIALPLDEASIVVKPLYDEPLVVLAPKQHLLAQSKAVTPKDLVNETLLLPGKGHCLRQHILDACPNCNITHGLQEAIEGASIETLRHMVASGLGLTVLPVTATQIKSYSHALCTIPFQSNASKRTIGLAWRSTFTRPEAIDAVITALKKSNLSTVCPITPSS